MPSSTYLRCRWLGGPWRNERSRMPISSDSERERLVMALAGRRVDAPDAKQPRFPPRNADEVRARIRRLFDTHNSAVLVGSAACGADILSLEAVGKQSLRRHVIL